MPYKIMVVDDEPANLRLLERLFRRDYEVLTAASGAEALRLLEQHNVALLITDQRMPSMTGLELLQRASVLRPHMVRIIITGYTDVNSVIEAINCGQVYKYVTKPWNNEDLRLTASRALEHYESGKARYELTLANQRLDAQLKEMGRGFVRAIADALEAKDEHILGHARRASGYSVSIGRRLGLDEDALEQLSLAAFLHDIGKIGTPENILLKPAPLTPEERAVVQLHSERGARMLASVPGMADVATAVRHHHEFYDGTGYPEGLGGELIPLASRIILVADAYDALTSPRPFREACDHETALQTLAAGAGTKFDPAVVAAFNELEAFALIRRSIVPEIWGAPALTGASSLEGRRLSFAEMCREVEMEPVLAACVLREANMRGDHRPTTKLPEACARLGEGMLGALTESLGAQSRAPFREHSVRAAAAARLLAERTSLLDADDAYLLGLLHDVGEMLLHSLFPAEMRGMEGLEEDARLAREVEAFGVDHAQIGQWVLESCGLPRTLTAIVQTHHDVLRVNAPSALLLHVANVIARADSSHKAASLDVLGSDRLAMLGLNRTDLATIHTGVNEYIERELAVLG
ncbi:MAG TPA: HD domain-containing phosphohydrolase [Pyrinomonadaceae bacterium]|nr:HD domain-containing phosphohydrolase [Pyrinomonadaceae bacterium]